MPLTDAVTLTDAQVEHLEKVFKSFDADGSGSLSAHEIEEVVVALGVMLTKHEIASMIKAADHDNSGSIELPEFLKAIESTLANAEKEGRLGSFAHIIARKAKSGPPLLWLDSKVGNRIQISPDLKTVARDAADGWGVQIFDQWLACAGDLYNVADVMLDIEQVTGGNLFVGIVGRNFFPSEWSSSLAGNKHAVVVHAEKGAVWRKEMRTELMLGPIVAGQRIHLLIEMLRQEMTISLIGADMQLIRSVSASGLPPEVTVAVCMGPGAQKVRIVGSSTDTAVGENVGKTMKDLWDDDNVQRLHTEKRANSATLEAVAQSLE